MPRYFTIAQAERLLPQVQRHLEDALFQKAEMQSAHEELERTMERIRMLGGVQVDPVAMRRQKSRRDGGAEKLREALEAVNEIGAQVKDLDIGLIDFLSQYQGREVCLCWKLGESGIAFWHSTTEGFRGRKPIDDDFLREHRGDGLQ